jgi:hypothetical protein
VDLDKPQPEYVQLKGRAGREVVAEWKGKREMAERAGGTFVVKAKVDADGPPVFGKRQSGHGASGAKRGWLARTFNARRDND